MINESILELDINDIQRMVNPSECGVIGGKFLIAEIRGSMVAEIINRPFRFNGHMEIFCTKGGYEIEINRTSHLIEENTIVISMPGNIWKLSKSDRLSDGESQGIIIATTPAFTSGLMFDTLAILDEGEAVLENPIVRLNEKQAECAYLFAKLAIMVSNSGAPRATESLQFLASAGMNMVRDIWVEQVKYKMILQKSSPRSNQVFDSFLVLAKKYYQTERGVAFYAEKLGLTPKYLSRLVREVSGQSAPDWIDSFVIIEAKNLLRYSSRPIKEIAASLSFTSPSAFHAFFKSRTGMTPVEFRES